MFGIEDCSEWRIGLVDVDSTIPNLALMKISSHFKKKGFKRDLIKLNYSGYEHHKREKVTIDGSKYDKIFISSIYPLNKELVSVKGCRKVYRGGTGYNIYRKIPLEIEKLSPDYKLYRGNKYSIGYLTRGCNNNCKYCFVPEKEGKLKEHSPLKEFYNPKLPKIMLLDNNFLACKNCIKLLKELKKTNKKVTFKQGLDFRLLTEEKAKILSELDYDGEYIFAFDRPKDKLIIKRNLKIWRKYAGDWKTKFYVLVGFDTTLKEDLERVSFLKRNKCLPYVMRHSNCYSSKNKPFYTDLAAWCNQPGLFKNLSFKEFLRRRHVTKERLMKTRNIIKSMLK
ncbi:MAG: radical SAM protein [Nanoarchaeota archaeon]|nr:radical SAM protein [Nanoarchaeota archaeon]